MAPDLNIPSSTNTVSVSVIDTTTRLAGLNPGSYMSPNHPKHSTWVSPAFSFLIQHQRLGRTIIFDLGIRKDWWNATPAVEGALESANAKLFVEEDVRDILEENGVDLKTIEAVVWSHWHFDHIGDPSRFDASTKLIVGPGFTEHMLPAYPVNPDSTFQESDLAGRELVEVTFPEHGPMIGRFRAIDYFGDGSFYFLDAPGHAVGHLVGFARVTSNPDSFIVMGADTCHHSGELRPSRHMPLPESIDPNPLLFGHAAPPCLGAIFETILRDGDRTKPFYTPTGPAHNDIGEAVVTIEKMQDVDVHDNIIVVMAHDEMLLDVLDFYPKSANDFMKKGWARQSRWMFLRDLARAAGYEGEITTTK